MRTATLRVTDAQGRLRPPVSVECDAAYRQFETRGDLKAAAIEARRLLRLDGDGEFAGRLTVTDDAGECVSLNLRHRDADRCGVCGGWLDDCEGADGYGCGRARA